eukprot:gene9773-13146_t
MLCFLNRLPKIFLCQLYGDWLMIIDISMLDCAVCGRDELLKIISSLSMLSCIKSNISDFSLLCWSWLSSRNICVDCLIIGEQRNQITFQTMVEQLTKIDADETIEVSNTNINTINSLNILSRLESLSISYADNDLMMQLSSCCTNLKSFKLHYGVDDIGLTSLLKANLHTLTELSFFNFYFVNASSPWPILLSKITKLEICNEDKMYFIDEQLWYSISTCLGNLTTLILKSITIPSWRKSLTNLTNLNYLEILFVDKENEENKENEIDDDRNGLFPQSLIGLTLRLLVYPAFLNDIVHLQNIMSFHELTNLKELSLIYDTAVSLINNPIQHITIAKTVSPSFPPRCLDLISNKTLSHLPFPASLMELNMYSCGGVDNDTITAILTRNNLSNLTSLNLSNNYNIHAEAILEYLPWSLILLELTNCPDISIGTTTKCLTFRQGCKPELIIKNGNNYMTRNYYYYFE